MLESTKTRGLSVKPVLKEPTHLFGIPHVLSCPLLTIVATAVAAGLSSSGPRGMEPPPKKVYLRAFLQVSS
jgi:hypothetical protein